MGEAQMKFKARRGAVVVILGIMAVALMSISAISIDFSRLWTLRNELQTSADAAAHAGAVDLAANPITSAQAFANVNKAMQDTVRVDSILLGDWNDAARTFTPGTPLTNAVSVTVSRQSTGLIMALVGVTPPRLKARAIGWADAPIANAAGCIKPWAVPYVTLMYRINLYRNANGTGPFSPPNSFANMTRPFDQVEDIKALNNMTAAERTFSLKQGSGQVHDSASASMPGNYQAVVLPSFYDGPTAQYEPSSGPTNGGSRYRDNIAGATCNTLDVGDSLVTESGNMPGPTMHGFLGTGGANGPGVCAQIRGETDNTPRNDPTYGDCLDANGNTVDVRSAFYYCATGCNGRTKVEVKLIGSFTLKKVYPKNDTGNNPQFDMLQIVGIFKPITDPGTVGPGSTTLVTVIIVK
jgi:Flp pilus assembly protein TadG